MRLPNAKYRMAWTVQSMVILIIPDVKAGILSMCTLNAKRETLDPPVYYFQYHELLPLSKEYFGIGLAFMPGQRYHPHLPINLPFSCCVQLEQLQTPGRMSTHGSRLV